MSLGWSWGEGEQNCPQLRTTGLDLYIPESVNLIETQILGHILHLNLEVNTLHTGDSH